MRLITTLLSGFILILFSTVSIAQTCTERLQLAQTAYDEGRIHDLVDEGKFQQTWGQCLNDENFDLTKEERVQAFRLLTLTYLQLDEPVEADKYMLKLLETDPEYIINEAVDPTEFINLYNTFRTDPIITIGVRGGTNFDFQHIQSRSTAVADPNNPSTQVPTPGFQGGLSAEFDLFDKIILNPEIFFNSFKLVSDQKQDFTETKYTTTVNSLKINAVGHYNLLSNRNVRLYGSFGLYGYYRLTVRTITTGTSAASEEIIESTNALQDAVLNDLNAGLLVGGSARFKLGRPWITLDLRYNFNVLQSLNDPYGNPSYIITFGGPVFNKFRSQNIIINAGIQLPIFNHIKLEQK